MAVLALTLFGAACASAGEDPDGNGLMNQPTAGNGMNQPIAGNGTISQPMGGSGSVGPTNPAGNDYSSLPCDVQPIVKNRCGNCHGASPIGGAPMSLVTAADFAKDHTSVTTQKGTTMKVWQWVKMRINDKLKPMPQGAPLQAVELNALNTWLDQSAPAIATGASCGDVTTPTAGTGSVNQGGTGSMAEAGTGGSEPTGSDNRCEMAGAYEPLVARDGETCYDFPVHAPGSDGKFTVIQDEHYDQFYFDIPWEAGSLGTRFGADFDNLKVLHHWLAFAVGSLYADGDVATNVTGTTLLEGGSELIGGWAVGGCNVEFPSDMGLKLPQEGMIMVQWHMFNFTGADQEDGTKVQICTVPSGARPNVGGLTWLGTENVDTPAGQMSDHTGTCINDSSAPITIVAFWPHMHEIGIHMKSVVTREGSATPETVFDKPFQFDHQIHYDARPYVVLQPGDSIASTCTYMNNTGASISFGQSTKQEMCYQFAFSYPYGELNNGVISLIGANNTCWQTGE